MTDCRRSLGGLIVLAGVALTLDSFSNTTKGPSTNFDPFLVPLQDGIEIVSLISAGKSEPQFGGYFFTGAPEGLAAFDNGDGTFTVLVTHEIPWVPDIPFVFTNPQPHHAHGGRGAHVAKWILNKPNHPTDPWKVVSGQDLIQSIRIWRKSRSRYEVSEEENLQVLCSCTLAEESAYFNAATGLGTQTKILTAGEEFAPEVVENPLPFLPPLFDRGDGGRPFAVIVDGPSAGEAWELPRLGNMLVENVVPSPFPQDKTVVILTDDEGPGQIYLYIGTKTNTGNDIDKAGLTNGKLFGIQVNGKPDEMKNAVQSGDAFSLADLGDVSGFDHDDIESMSEAQQVTFFAKPEDSHWDTQDPNRFYVATSGARLDGIDYPSRLWRFTLTDIRNPEQGGTLEIVLEEGRDSDIQSLDNIAVDTAGDVLMQEDEGGSARRGKVWRYVSAANEVHSIAEHNPRFFSSGGEQFLTNHEESAGIIDVSHILGTGWYLLASQAHVEGDSPVERFDNYELDPPYYEESQLMAMRISSGGNPAATLDVNLSIERNGNTLTVRFLSEIGKTYQVQTSPDLLNWSDQGEPLIGTGAEESAPITSASRGFVRVSQQ